MKTIIDVFTDQLQKFIDTHFSVKKDAILFFQGFPTCFYEAIERTSLSHFCNIKNNGYIDYRNIKSSIVITGLLSAKGLCWGYYEEFIGLNQALNDFSVYQGEIHVITNNLYSDYFPIPVRISQDEALNIYENESPNIKENPILSFYSDTKIENRISYYSYVNKHYDIDVNIKVHTHDFFNKSRQANQTPRGVKQVVVNIQDLQLFKTKLLNGNLAPSKYSFQFANNDLKLEKDIDILNSIGNELDIYFQLESSPKVFKEEQAQAHSNLLRKYWGKDAKYFTNTFYKDPSLNTEITQISQGTLIADIINQCEAASKGGTANYSDIVITAPTGSGKSLLFQLPAIYLHENHQALTIIICPLIALMNDQVIELQERGIHFATFINSEITVEERQSRLQGIANGKYSILYLSPEFLLSYNIKNIIGDRSIGLLVVDEAHLVTSWGRDFRVDYWFLGDYIEKLRKGSYYSKNKGMNFPVLSLTATAVYGGRDDVIEDLLKSLSLNCSSDHLFIGHVCRENIQFKIRQHQPKKSTSHKEVKTNITIDNIRDFIKNKEKTIVYFPYVSQIEDVKGQLAGNKLVERYSGTGMGSLEKNISYNRFRDSSALVMLATKAFGMGVNIPDITNVYHYAPTGTLSDYVQEIGRGARKLKQGYAITDYHPNDMQFARILWGLSGLRHYQLKAIIKKLYELYRIKNSRNMLFSPDVFSYLFDANSIERKVKSGLMLLSADLLEKYHFRVITVRPKNLFTNHFIVVPRDVEADFLREFGNYCRAMKDDKPRITLGYGNRSDVTTYNYGKIYEIRLGDVWEKEFTDLSFAKFKHHFFSGDLFSFGDNKIVPRLKLVINYEHGFDYAKKNLLKIASALQQTFNLIHQRYGGKNFKFSEYGDIFTQCIDRKISREYLMMMLDMFCYEKTDIYSIPNEQWKFIERRKGKDSKISPESEYCIRTVKHGFIENNIRRYLNQASPNSDDGKKFITYLTIPKQNGKYSEYQLVASILQLHDLATYDLIGGRNLQIFVRINDPLKLKQISDSDTNYRNRILIDIEERHARAVKIMNSFMKSDFDDRHRWDVIENYFLGNDGIVDIELGITT